MLLGLAHLTDPIAASLGFHECGACGAGSPQPPMLHLDVEGQPMLLLLQATLEAPDKIIAGTDPWSVSASPEHPPPGPISRSHEELHHLGGHRPQDVVVCVHLGADTGDDRAVQPVVGHLPDEQLDRRLDQLEDHSRELPAPAAAWEWVTRRQ